jgi:hypothetical protein
LIKWSALEQGLREREQRKLRELMGDGPYELAHRAGSALTQAQAVELALLPSVGSLDADTLDLPRLASPL